MKNTENDQEESVNKVRTTSVGWLIKRVGQIMDDSMNVELAQLGITIDQFKIVMTLLEFEGISQSKIGKRVMLPSYAVTRNLDTLEKMEIIVRKPDKQSRRSFSIKLTPRGKRLGPELFRVVKSVNLKVMGVLSKEEEDALASSLNKIVGAHSI